MTGKRGMKTIALFLLAAGAGGCSWIFVEGPPPDHAELDYFTCTTSKAAPRLDVIGAGLSALWGTLFLATPADDSFFSDSDHKLIAWSYLGQAAIQGAAARSGFGEVNACHEAIRMRGERNRARQAVPEDARVDDAEWPETSGPGPVGGPWTPSWTQPLLFPVKRPGS